MAVMPLQPLQPAVYAVAIIESADEASLRVPSMPRPASSERAVYSPIPSATIRARGARRTCATRVVRRSRGGRGCA